MNSIEEALLKIDAFPYDNFPKIKKAMLPYEKMLDKLLITTALLKKKSLFKNAHKVKLYAAAKPMFSVLNFTDRVTEDFIRSCVILYPPYIDQCKQIAKEKGVFFSDDTIAFSLAHELGHLQQILDKSKYTPWERELAADQFGASLIAKAGYSVYRAIKGLPVLAAEQESAEHPPLSERRIKLIDYALNNNLFNEKEKQEAMDLRKEIEDFVLSKKAKGLKPVPALPKKTKHSGVLPKDISSLKMGISRLLAKASIELLGEITTGRVIDYFKKIENTFVNRDNYFGWEKYGVVEYDKLKKAGIIDDKGRVLDLQKLQQSDLVVRTPETFHYAGGMPVQLCQAPSLKFSETGKAPASQKKRT